MKKEIPQEIETRLIAQADALDCVVFSVVMWVI